MIRKLIWLSVMGVMVNAAGITQSFAEVNDSAIKIKWSYDSSTGPDNWGSLGEAFKLCSNGTTQSPIDIGAMQPNNMSALTVNYQPSVLILGDDLNTNVVIANQQEVINTGHGLQVNFRGSPPETMTFDGVTYNLIQFHTPSETRVQGKQYPAEIHFVHQGKNGALAVMGVLVREGNASQALEKIVKNLPEHDGMEHEVSSERINPAHLLPNSKNYYSFPGSLTTPPCTEGLQWIVLANQITASADQIASIQKENDGNNARPVQSANGRKIYYAVE